MRPLCYWLLLLLVTLVSGSAHAAQRFALLVGANAGWEGDRPLRFAEEDTRRLGAVLTELGGFADKDIVILDAPHTQQLRAQLKAVKQRLADAGDEETLFLFYYSGHADHQQLHLQGPPFSLEELYRLLRELPATVKLGILDACRSGAIVSVKGATAAPSFKVEVQDEMDDVRGTVILTSSGADELSQETRALAGSFFTNHLVSGLRGAADENGDHQISLDEVYSYAFERTLVDTAITQVGPQHPSYRKELKGRGRLYLTQLENKGALLLLPPGGKRCFVVTADERRLAAEAVPRQDAGVRLALPEGPYRIKCAAEGKYLVASVELKANMSLELTPGLFQEAPLSEGVIKASPSELAESIGYKLMAHAEALRTEHPEQLDLSVLLATESVRRVPSAQSRQVLLRGLERLPRAGTCVKHGAPVLTAAWSRDGQHLATAAQDHTLRVWSPETGAERHQLSHVRSVQELAWSSEGNVLNMRDSQGEVLQWRFEPGTGTAPRVTGTLSSATAFDPAGMYAAFMDQGETLSLRRQATGTEVLRVNSMRPLLGFSGDGRFLAGLDTLGKARVWEIATRQELLATLPTEARSKVFRPAISPAGRFLALGTEGSKEVRLWEVATGRQLSPLVHEGPVTALAFASSNTLLTASEDKTVRLWEVTGRELSRMPHEAQIETLSLSPDAEWLATTWLGGRSVRIWDMRTGQEFTRLVHGDSVNAIAWSPREGWLATASVEGTACTWELTSEEVARMPGWGQHTGMAFTQDGQRLVTATEDEPARVWEVATGRQVVELEDTGGADLLVLNPDGKTLATASGSLARVWDMATGKERSRLRHAGFIHSLAFSPNGAAVASASQDGTAHVWEAATGLKQVTVKHESPIKAVAFSPRGKHLATGGEDQTARLWELATGKELFRLEHKPLPCQEPPAADHGPCQQGSLPDTSSSLESVHFGPDGRYLATVTLDAVARVWDAESGKELLRKPHSAAIRALVFTPDGKGVAIASGEPIARIWDVETSLELTFLETDDGITSVQYSADGKYLLTSSAQGKASIWETSSGRVLALMPGDPDAEAFLLSPDGRYLATASAEGTGSHLLYSLHAWHTEDLIQQSCARLRRNLTEEEWRKYLGDAEPYQKTCTVLP